MGHTREELEEMKKSPSLKSRWHATEAEQIPFLMFQQPAIKFLPPHLKFR
jgi:hypothetical protein